MIEHKFNNYILIGLDTNKSRLNSKLNKELTYLSDHTLLARYYLYFDKDNKIYFPSWYTLNQKKTLINDLIFSICSNFSFCFNEVKIEIF